MATRSLHTTQCSKPRFFAINALIGVIIAGMLYCNFSDTDAWPFCNYAMFSWISNGGKKNPWEIYVVRGGIEEAVPAEDGILNREFDRPATTVVLKRISGKYGVESDQMTAFLQLYLRKYEDLNREKISGLKLYQVEYEFNDAEMKPEIRGKKLLREIRNEHGN